jgi:hypothetical protein
MHLAKPARDEAGRAQREAARSNLLAELPKLAAAEARLVKRIATIEDDALVAALKEEWQQAKAQREEAEQRVASLEGLERDLRAEREAVERLRTVWKDWAGALDADPVLARQLLRKVLGGPIRGVSAKPWPPLSRALPAAHLDELSLEKKGPAQ